MNELAAAESCDEVMSGWWHSRRAKKALLAGAIVGGAVYGLGDLVSGLLYEGYSFRDQAISELTAFGSPVRPLMLTVMIVHSLPLLAFAVGIWRVSNRKSLRGVGAALIAASVVGLPIHTIWAMSSRWMETGFNDTMHISLAIVWSLLIFVAVVLSVVAYKGWFRLYAIATLLILVGFGAAASMAIQGIDQNLTPWAGAFERVNAYSYFAWLAVLAVTVIRRSLGEATATAGVAGVEARTKGPVVLGSH